VIHDLSESTKRFMDVAGAVSAVAAISLSQAALVASFVAALLSIAWYGIRIYDRLRYGRGGE
jgi:hypothetical protein